MTLRIAVLAETDPNEGRVSATPVTIKKLTGMGANVAVQAGAGLRSGLRDADFETAGATVTSSAAEAVAGADVVLSVRRPTTEQLAGITAGAVVLSIADPYGNEAELEKLAGTRASVVAMELVPRITRAQVMDVLSSQANLAGYRAVVEAASEYGRVFPMMMTAAGTIPAARVFVMGAGVAGLQAIATARRLGAIVTATDVRPASKEQVESLGAKFIAVEDEEFKQAETSGGYAKEMSAEYRAKQAELLASHIAKQDVVITTALIPGRPAPKLVTTAMVESMKRGSVLVDLAVERGGNVEGAKSNEIVDHNGVKIVGYGNMAGRLAASASGLYAKNLLAFLELVIKDGAIAVNWDDEIIKASVLTRDGAVVHPNFQSKGA
jgi:NAD(P) transhydrogenase subunit alpha